MIYKTQKELVFIFKPKYDFIITIMDLLERPLTEIEKDIFSDVTLEYLKKKWSFSTNQPVYTAIRKLYGKIRFVIYTELGINIEDLRNYVGDGSEYITKAKEISELRNKTRQKDYIENTDFFTKAIIEPSNPNEDLTFLFPNHIVLGLMKRGIHSIKEIDFENIEKLKMKKEYIELIKETIEHISI